MPRLGSAKSSTGCTTCKVRRVKCDETHPACRRCTSTGRKCDGFPTSLIVKINPLSYRAIARPRKSVGIYVNVRQEQIQAHQFFVVRLVPYMTRVVNNTFWDKHVLQVALSEQPVWLAISAMSELVKHGEITEHSSFGSLDDDSRLSNSLQWYTRSVYEMQKVIDSQPEWSVICGITAIIYFCIECLLDNLQNARLIYERAVFAVMTAQLQDTNTLKQEDPMKGSITNMFDHIAIAHGFRPVFNQVSRSEPTTAFHDIHDARSILETQLVAEAHEFAKSIEQERLRQPRYWVPSVMTREKGDDILAELRWWRSNAMKVRATELYSIDSFHWAFLLLIHLNYVIWVTAMIQASETDFDTQHDLFEEMLQHARVAIEASGSTQPLFSFDTRVIPSLTFVATRCRHPILRRKAVSLLYMGPRIENTRKASSAILLAQKVIAIEETGDPNAIFSDETVSTELPADANRLGWATVEQNTENLRTRSFLKFGRWRLNELQDWYLSEEQVSI